MPFSRFRPQLPALLAVGLLLPALALEARELEVLPEYEAELATIAADPRGLAALADVVAMDDGVRAHSLPEGWANRDGRRGMQKALRLARAEAGFEPAN